MSILLKALRKSENDQQKAEVPTIHSGDPHGQVSDSLNAGPLVLLLSVTLFACGWFVWQQYRQPPGSHQPPDTLIADQAAVVGPRETAGEATGQAKSPTVPGRNSSARPRTPVESYQQPTRDISKPSAGGTATPDIEPATSQSADRHSGQTGSSAANSSEPGTANRERPRAGEPQPISYWELPDAIRTDVPEIRFTVLVYADKPDNRFVLINGQRLGEGDSIQPGLVVKEIRREGVVFSYRLYQFLIER